MFPTNSKITSNIKIFRMHIHLKCFMPYLRTGKGVCKTYTAVKRSLINYVKD